MSKKMRMQSVDKSEVKAAVKVVTKAKLERVSQIAGLNVGTYVAAVIEEYASKIETTKEDLDRANEIVASNIEKRNALKAKKGIK